jgi:hypothetical protein
MHIYDYPAAFAFGTVDALAQLLAPPSDQREVASTENNSSGALI